MTELRYQGGLIMRSLGKIKSINQPNRNRISMMVITVLNQQLSKNIDS
jgi:hypothetical protein